MVITPILAVALALIGLAIVWAVVTYNGLVQGGLRVDEAWSTIAVQLKRRASLVPNLVETARGYATHERETLTEVTQARQRVEAAVGASEAEAANAGLTRAIGRLLVVAESYPTLKASDSFTNLQKELSQLEEKIAFARQFYNRTVLDFNSRVSTLPSSIIAGVLSLRERPFFELDEPAATPKVSFAPNPAAG